MQDRRLKVSTIAVSEGSVVVILQDRLGMSEVLRMSTPI
jgi:hypothetical protein